jgi:diguanylate cyclase (GGDEF)-like protein
LLDFGWVLLGMNIYALFPLIATLAYIPLLVTTCSSRPWTKRNTLFVLFLIPAIIWSLSDLFLRITFLSEYKLDFFRLLLLSFTWAVVQLHCLTSSFYPPGKSRWTFVAYGTLLTVIALVATGMLPVGIKINPNGSVLPNYGIWIFAIIIPFVILAGRNYYVLYKTLKITENPEIYNQIVTLMLGISVLLVFTLSSFIPWGAEFPISHLGNLIVAFILSYAVVRHKLVPINVVIRRSLVWLSLGILAVFGYGIVLIAVQTSFGIKLNITSALAASMLATVIAAAAYSLRDVFSANMSRLFQTETYKYRQNLTAFVDNIHKIFNFAEQGKEFLLLIAKTFTCKDVCLLFLEPNSENFVSILVEPDTLQNPMSNFQLSGHNPIAEYLRRESRPLARSSLEILPELKSVWLEEKNIVKNYGIELFVPLVSRGKLIGILLLGKKQMGRYTLSDYNLLEDIARGVATSMEKEYIQQQLRDREKELSIINRSNLIINSSLDIQRTYDNFAKEIRRIVDVSWTGIEVIEENEVLFLTLSTEVGSAWQVGERVAIKDTPVEWVSKNKQSLVEQDLTFTSRFIINKYHIQQGIRSTVHVPLLVDDEVIGVLAVASRNPNAYTKHHVMLLEELASQITESVENSRLFAKAEQMSRIDGLTGMLNRHSFDEQIANEMGRHMRYGGVFSVIIMDVDSFKTVNDNFGHQTGDKVLRQFSKVMKNTVRSSDQVFRYGGDEFAILLPQTNCNAACIIGERVRERIVNESKLDNETITISLGVACWPEDGLVGEQLVVAADTAMYAAKKNGGNCCRRFESSMQMIGKSDNKNVSQSEYLSTIYAMAAAVDARDRYTRSHSQKVNDFALGIAESLHMSPLETNRLSMCALLHDLGKIGVSSEILNKNGKLSEEDWEIIRQHPQLGASIISHVQNLVLCVPGILYHHEQYDGKGYPQGLKGEDIPLEARILAIADSFAAMTSERHYMIAMTYEKAINELKSKSGTQFDPSLVEVFIGCNIVTEERKAESDGVLSKIGKLGEKKVYL